MSKNQHIHRHARKAAIGLLLVGSVTLDGCSHIPFISSTPEQDRAAQLAVPPAFTAPNPRSELALPEIASARATAVAEKQKGGGVLASSEGVKVAGGPDSRYLVVAADPESVWPKLQSFLQDEGYNIKEQQPAAGYIQTDWTGVQSGNQNGFSLMRFFKLTKDFFFKPDHIERVRVRIEQGDSDKQTLVFVTSQKMELTGDKPLIPGEESYNFKYADPKPDAALSAKVMARLAAYLSGKSEAESRAMMDATFAPRAKIVSSDEKDKSYISVSQGYPQVWNRTGLALDRLGFDPIKSDRKDGTIEVKHKHPQTLYSDIAIRGVKIDRSADMTLHLVLKVLPQRDGTTNVTVDSLQVGGGNLPEIRQVLLRKLSDQLR